MLNKIHSKLVFSTILTSILALTACSNSETEAVAVEGSTATSSEQEQTSAPVATAATTDANPQEKLNAYIACSNGTLSRFYDSFNRYKLWVTDMDGGPTGNETHTYGLYSLSENSVEDCVTNGMAATKMAPSLPELDNAAADYITAIKEYDDVSRKASDYYEQGNYKDDGFALGQELHPQLVSAYEKADKAAINFDTQLTDFNRKVRTERLNAIEQAEGKKFNYHLLALSLKAEDMVNYISKETFEAEQAQTLIKEYEDAAKDFKAYVDTKAEDVPNTITAVDMSIDDLLVAAKNRMRHVRDGKEFTQAEIGNLNSGAGWMVEGSTDRVIKDYNMFVQSLNSFS